ncbi:cupin domain-containing protein [Mesorhizobium sp.]|uniref:cupin domain-containing protein n=1 Tax=Mesorhizobium sp. TaxID=1871066 RepID=UPI0012161957|nr:cupin domain-containing protein [Mesorhizobium sp.]TIL30452.1 MAG: cupin domain-containing protein [Mesorhizobium sp.]TIL51143.1 MAG: cupin domain-containing protein [Mesorhizobium sp.]
MRMIKLTGFIGSAGIAVALASTTLYANMPGHKTVIPVSQKMGAPGFDETVRPVFERAIPNIPGKSLIAVEVIYPPGGKSAPHFHTKSAFIYAHVLSGAIRSQVDGEPAKVYQVGEGFYENPGSHHRVSENSSATEPASLLAVFITDPTDTLTIPQQQ